ncbi:MAG: hypothetical protein ACLR0U_27050 [Enterocloster clostridioformis]
MKIEKVSKAMLPLYIPMLGCIAACDLHSGADDDAARTDYETEGVMKNEDSTCNRAKQGHWFGPLRGNWGINGLSCCCNHGYTRWNPFTRKGYQNTPGSGHLLCLVCR